MIKGQLQNGPKGRHPGAGRGPGCRHIFKWLVYDLDSGLRRNDSFRNSLNRLPPLFLFVFHFVLFFLQPTISIASNRKQVLLDRAVTFQELGLMNLARRQYKYIQGKFPGDTTINKELKYLSLQESSMHYQNALFAKKNGTLKLALLEVSRALSADPNSQKTEKLQDQIIREEKLQRGLKENVSKDYLEGLKYFQDNRLNRALESFVKVLNMHPDHRGALTYIEKIGERIETEGKQ